MKFGKGLGRVFLYGLLDAGPFLIVLTATLISIIGLISLVGVDVVSGEVTASHILPLAPWWFHWFVSFATTGVLVATIGTAVKLIRTRWQRTLIWIIVLLLVGGVIQYGDYRLDTASVDILRFNEIVNVSEKLTPAEAEYHIILRHVVGAISLFGEPVAAVAIVIFPEIRNMLDILFEAANKAKNNYRPSTSYNRPSPEPVRSVTYKTPQSATKGSKDSYYRPAKEKQKGALRSPIFNDAYVEKMLKSKR